MSRSNVNSYKNTFSKCSLREHLYIIMDPSQEEYSQNQDVTSSPVRGRPRARVLAAVPPKAKEAKVKPEGETKVTKPRARKATEESAPKVSKRAKSMVAAAKEGKVKSAKKSTKKKYEVMLESALKSLDENSTQVYADIVGEDQVDRTTAQLLSRQPSPRRDGEDEFEVEDLTVEPVSPASALSPMVPWGAWALSPADRSDGATTSLIVTEEKLKNYYLVTFEDWLQVPVGRHTKYTTIKRFGARSGDADFHERKVVHAVVGDMVPGDNPGRMCSGWKSDMAPWKRTNYDTLNFYVKKGDLPSNYTR